MKSKYQIFVSSTYEDLKSERESIIKAILEMGHIPVGMEMFSAGDEQQWELIKRQIEDCDYYIVAVAHRYGSMDGVISYTEKEYDYAVSKGIPTLGFIINDDARWPKSKMDTDSAKQESIAEFKEKVKKKIVSFWKNSDDLYAKVSISLSKAITSYPRPGWIRATEMASTEVMNEMSRLSKENGELRSALAASELQRKSDTEEEKKKTMILLKKNSVQVAFYFDGDTDWTRGLEVPLYRVFRLLAPELMVEKSVHDTARFLGTMLRPKDLKKEQEVRSQWPIPSNTVREWLADLHALELIAPSSKKHALQDTGEYWSITPKGRSIYAMIRIAALESRASKGHDERENP